MHAALLRPDGSEAAAWPEIEAMVRDPVPLDLSSSPTRPAPFALIVDVDTHNVGRDDTPRL